MPDTYVIFITEKDVIGCGLPVYEIKKVISQNGQIIEDGAHIIYVNGAYRGNNALGKLMEDFNNPEPDSMNYDVIRLRSKYLKEEEGEGKMCAFTQEVLEMGEAWGMAKGRAEGRVEGKVQGILQSVRNLMDSYKLTAQAAMDVLKVSAADRPAILAAL